jgi:HD superfamily phosphohydrolase
MASKIFRDPVHGNLLIPRGLLLDLIDSPEFQRLRHIRQLGMCYTTFHGAEHSRFQHALGVLWLTLRVISVWQQEFDFALTPDERDCLCAAALLHDLGHGPFSHALEGVFVGVSHEWLGHHLIKTRMAPIFHKYGRDPQMVVDILRGHHPRLILHELISSQLDVDRMDYLQRDALYTGAKYGLFDCERIIYSLAPLIERGTGQEVLALHPKATEAVEEFLFSRYYMHWQVYFHRTVRSAELLLRAILERAHEVWTRDAGQLHIPPNLVFLFEQPLSGQPQLNPEFLSSFVALDDSDILQAVKLWSISADAVLADLAQRFLSRRLYKAIVHPGEGPVLDAIRSVVQGYFPEAESYYLREDIPWDVALQAPRGGTTRSPIRVYAKDGSWKELSRVTRTQAVQSLANTVAQSYLMIPPECRPQIETILLAAEEGTAGARF